MLRNVFDFDGSTPGARITTALASVSLTEGDRLYIPCGIWEAPPEGWVVSKNIELFGDGVGGDASGGTRLVAHASPLPGSSILRIAASVRTQPIGPVSIKDLTIEGQWTENSPEFSGIRFHGDTDTPPNEVPPGPLAGKLSNIRLERIRVTRIGGIGIRLHGGDGGNAAVIGDAIADVEVSHCRDVGMSVRHATFMHLARSRFLQNGKAGLTAWKSEVSLHACAFELNRALEIVDSAEELDPDMDLPQNYQSAGAPVRAEAVFSRAIVAVIQSCTFRLRGFGTGQNKPIPRGVILQASGGAATIRSTLFTLNRSVPEADPVAIGIELRNTTKFNRNGTHTVFSNRFVGVTESIRIPNLSRHVVLHPQHCETHTQHVQLPGGVDDAPVGVPSQHGSSGTYLSGVCMPRVDDLPLVVGPQAGSIAYHNGRMLVYFPSTGWRSVVHGNFIIG